MDCERGCVECPDLSGDGIVDNSDASLLVTCTSSGNCPEEYDLDGDGIVSLLYDLPCILEHEGENTEDILVCNL